MNNNPDQIKIIQTVKPSWFKPPRIYIIILALILLFAASIFGYSVLKQDIEVTDLSVIPTLEDSFSSTSSAFSVPKEATPGFGGGGGGGSLNSKK